MTPNWKTHAEGSDPLPPSEVIETGTPGLYEVALKVATRPVAEGRIASGLHS